MYAATYNGSNLHTGNPGLLASSQAQWTFQVKFQAHGPEDTLFVSPCKLSDRGGPSNSMQIAQVMAGVCQATTFYQMIR